MFHVRRSEINEDTSCESDDSLEHTNDDYDDIDYEPNSFLRNWVFQYNINHNALSSLLKYLRQKTGFENLPNDSRSLLCTPRSREIVVIDPGHNVHIGLKKSLDQILSSRTNKSVPEFLVLDFNIDGVPISRSSTSEFWLILSRIYNLPETSVFVIGIYHGYYKPKIFSSFLVPFVEEMKHLTNSYIYKEQEIKIKIRAFICDAPTRAYITGTKSHNAYFGCNKCIQEDVHIQSRMTFPENNAKLRTNDSFRNRTDENYHVYTSPLEELDINMVDQIPLDYLHTLCLGVTKKIIGIWLSGDLSLRLPSISVRIINERLNCITKSQPTEFQRKVRSLSEFGFSKEQNCKLFSYTLDL